MPLVAELAQVRVDIVHLLPVVPLDVKHRQGVGLGHVLLLALAGLEPEQQVRMVSVLSFFHDTNDGTDTGRFLQAEWKGPRGIATT